jgi:ABC-type uncharacterized transport system YnjBCD substrate-binding protein
VIVVTLSLATLAVVPVSPAPKVIAKVFGYRRITIPEPPATPEELLDFAPPPPFPVLAAAPL